MNRKLKPHIDKERSRKLKAIHDEFHYLMMDYDDVYYSIFYPVTTANPIMGFGRSVMDEFIFDL
jgi:hypothetical protein